MAMLLASIITIRFLRRRAYSLLLIFISERGRPLSSSARSSRLFHIDIECRKSGILNKLHITALGVFLIFLLVHGRLGNRGKVTQDFTAVLCNLGLG